MLFQNSSYYLLLAHCVIFLLTAYTASFFVIPIVAVLQERRLWKPPLVKLSLWGCTKVYLFNLFWFALSQLGSLILLPFFLIGANVEQLATVWVERYTGFFLLYLFVGPVRIRCGENLPPQQQNQQPAAFVYIANHSSQIDGGVVYFICRRFKWIIKQSIVYLPGIGLLGIIAGHIFIDRKKGNNKESVKKMYVEAAKALGNGKSIFIFPQGTRAMVGRLPFKDGAFNIAIESQVPIVPISIQIPKMAWNNAYPFNLLWNRNIEPVILTIHKAIPVTKDSNKEALKEECFNVIYSEVPNIGISKKSE
mmetsp:Transcript_24917/g.35703  ORF Transcript_24917/g.35703 Transcript_24917/m.35703 type:complete len:307 (-) Transcript_24917:50-970(-)